VADTLTVSQRREQLRCWYEEATAAGIPYCEYLHQQSCEGLNGGGSGVGPGGLVPSSVSSAGHSASYFPLGEQPVNPAWKMQYASLAADVCPDCAASLPPAHSDFDILNCLLGKIGRKVTSLYKCYIHLREPCGCC
jgi:hypothetical protein